MLAYHNNPATKAKYVARMKAHMEADAIVQRTGWDGSRGCAVGCTFQAYDHTRGPIEIGVPETLIWLEDAIFEGLPVEQAKGFPLAFLEAIPVGADLSMVWPRFALWLLTDSQFGVLRHCNDATRPVVEAVIGLYRRWLDGEQPAAEEFEAAAWAARTAGIAEEATWAAAETARGTAEVATRSEAWNAARTAARAAAEAAARAVRAARAAWATWAAWEAAKEGFWGAAQDELLRLLREAPVVEAE